MLQLRRSCILLHVRGISSWGRGMCFKKMYYRVGEENAVAMYTSRYSPHKQERTFIDQDFVAMTYITIQQKEL